VGEKALNAGVKEFDLKSPAFSFTLLFTHIPPAAQGGRESVDTISGRARNARPKQQIVIYAHSGLFWVHPWLPYLGS
jgi:hypothetical protein